MPKPSGNAFIELQRAAAAAYENKQYPLALKHIRKADKLAPKDPYVLNLLGVILRESGKTAEAERCLRESIRLKPDLFAPYHNLATILFHKKQWTECMEHLRTCVELNPQFTQAWMDLGEVLRKGKRTDLARKAIAEAIQQAPGNWSNWNNLGLTYYDEENYLQAIQAYENALKLNPKSSATQTNLASALIKLGRGLEAHPLLQSVVYGNEPNALACSLLASQLGSLGQYERAEQIFLKGIQLDPTELQNHWNYSLLLLGLGRLTEGWKLYCHRFTEGLYHNINKYPETVPVRLFHSSLPAWQGQDPKGKKILVWREQGIGDELFFVSVVPDLVAAGAQVTLLCSPRFVSAFARSFPDVEVLGDPYIDKAPDGKEQYPGFDYHIPVGELCRFFRNSAESFPGTPFIQTEPIIEQRLRDWLDSLGPQAKIGISWRSGGPYSKKALGKLYYSDLSQWGPIFAALPNATFINLLYGPVEEELQAARDQFGVTILQPPIANLKDDFDALFALCKILDLTVTVNSNIIDFCGSTGGKAVAWTDYCGLHKLALEESKILWYKSVRIIPRLLFTPWSETIQKTADYILSQNCEFK